jgi:hypothetical protein
MAGDGAEYAGMRGSQAEGGNPFGELLRGVLAELSE